MWIKPAVAGAAVVTALALGVWAGDASVPADTSSTVQVDEPDQDHDHGQKRGHDKPDRPDKADKADKTKPQQRGEHEAPPPHARDRGPRKPHPHGKVVPVGPRPYSETEE